jgi:glutamyl endopeptidase
METFCTSIAGEPSSGSGEGFETADLQTLQGHDAPPLAFLPPVPGIAEPENIFLPDTRVEIADTRPIPWRWVCHLVVENDRGLMFTGTGWLGGPHTVYTAAHVLMNINQAHRATRVWVIPGRQRNVGSTFEAVGMAVHPQWSNGQPAAFDVAAIWLPTPIGQNLGNFGFQDRPDAALNQLPVVSAGYPDARASGLPIGTPMRCDDRIRGVLPQLLATQLDTEVGQSGSPVFVNDARGPIVVGVHAYGNAAMNHAVRLTPGLVQQLKAWWR